MFNRRNTILLAAAAFFAFLRIGQAARVVKPSFDKAHGFYSSALSVRITCSTSGARIRYTTDGSKPSASHGTDMASGGTVSISRSTPLRAVGYKSGMTTSYPYTQTYIFVNDVVTQTRPSGYPVYWTDSYGTTKSGDYNMDSNIVNHWRYKDRIKNDLKALPTLSIVLPKEKMFGVSGGSDGIYNFGGYHGNENWKEVECSLELFSPTRAGFQIDCGIKGHSGFEHKRALRLLFKTNYGGPERLEYPFFEDAPLNKASAESTFGKIFMRSGHNDSWLAFWLGSKLANRTYLRDPWVRHTMLAMNGSGTHGTFMHVYINGMYWGIYNPQERPDARTAAIYQGGSKGDWYAVNHGGSISGDAWRYNYLHNTLVPSGGFSSGSKYNTVKQYLDVERYADYVMLGWYAGTGDWGANNFYAVVRNSPAGPVQYMVWDQDVSFDDAHNVENTGAWVSPSFLNYSSARYSDRTSPMCKLWRALDDNNDFMMMFADRVYKHCYNDGALTESKAKARWDTLVSYTLPGIVCESARWGDSVLINHGGAPRLTQYDHWTPACNRVRNEMLAGNVGRFISALRSKGYYPSLNPPTFSKHGGSVSSGFRLTISRNNSSGTIFYRTDGQDPRVDGGAVRSGSSTGGSSATVTLTSTATVKARVKNGVTWSALERAYFTVSGISPPSPPSGLTATAVSHSRIDLAWNDNSGSESGYKIDRRQSGTDPWVRIAEPGANTEAYSDTGLPSETQFYYKVKAYNGGGNSAYSNVDAATTPSSVPPAIAVSRTSIAVSVVVGEDAPNETFQVWNSGAATLDYAITDDTSRFAVSPTSGTSTGTGQKPTHTIVFSTASSAVGVYDREIVITDSNAANSPLKIPVQITVTESAPSQPASPAAVALSNTEIRFSWTDTADNEADFQIRRSADNSDWYALPAVFVAANTTSYTDSGLTPGATRWYKIKARNSAGESAYTAPVSATTDDPEPQIAVSTTSIQVSVTQGQDAADETFQVWNGGDGTLSYQVSDDTSKLSVSPTTGSSTGSGNKQTHTITFTTADLAPATYDRAITVADNGSGAVNGPVTIAVQITVTQATPGAPTGFTAAALSPTAVQLNWNDLPDETQYMLRKSLDGADWYAIPQVYHAADTTSYTDSGLDPETTYHYKLRGINDGGYGPYCTAISVTTPAATPPAIALGKTSIAVSCTQGADADDETFQVWNSGGGTLSYQVTDDTSKLSVSPASGSSSGSGDKQTHTVTFTTANLAVGVYDRTITVADDGSGASNGPITVPVQITVLAPTPFTAYNDLCWVSGEPTANITVLTIGDGGMLVDYQTGDATPVTLAVTGGAGPYTSQGVPADAGTDAHAVFDGKVGLNGLISYAPANLELAFSGLNSTLRYELVLFGNRGNAAYTARTTTVVLSGAEPGFRNQSTAGAAISTTTAANDTTVVGNGYNTVNGHVARYTEIDPGADGTVLLTVSDETSKFYANALMLRASEPGPDTAVKIANGASWRYRKGTAEASAPAGAWRAPGYDDSGWATGATLLGYGDGNHTYATTLSDMYGNYASVFMRRTFTIDEPAAISELVLDVLFDDAFILWINGREAARVNMSGAPGDPVAHDAFAASNLSSTTNIVLTGASLPELRAGANIAALQVFNRSLTSGDLTIELALTALEGSTLAASEDPDGDGMDDEWETGQFGGTDVGLGAPDEDFDGDGVRNIDEYIAGTGAADAGSTFAVTVILGPAGLEVSFPTVLAAGSGYEGLTRHYQLQQRGDLNAAGQWLPVPGCEDIPADGSVFTHTVTSPAAGTCYRGRVWLE